MNEEAAFDVYAVAVDVGIVVVAVEKGASERPLIEVLVGFEAAIPSRIGRVRVRQADEAADRVAVIASKDVASDAVGSVVSSASKMDASTSNTIEPEPAKATAPSTP